MNASRIFHGRVDEQGKLLLVDDEKPMRDRYLKRFAGRDVDITIRIHREKRSLDQNAYWHAVPFLLLSEEWGEDIETTKLLVLGECFGWREFADGRRIPMKPSTAALTTEEGSYLTEWMPPWAMTNFGVYIPLPEESEAA